MLRSAKYCLKRIKAREIISRGKIPDIVKIIMDILLDWLALAIVEKTDTNFFSQFNISITETYHMLHSAVGVAVVVTVGCAAKAAGLEFSICSASSTRFAFAELAVLLFVC